MASRARASSANELAAIIESDVSLDNHKTINSLLLAIPEVPRLMVACAIQNLGAVRCYFDRNQKAMVETPDGNTQMRAIAFLAAYRDGLPTQTSVAINLGERGRENGGALTVDEAMAASPALRAKLRAMLDGAEQKALKQADPPA